MAGTYTRIDWEAYMHTEIPGVQDWYNQQFDPLLEAINLLPSQEANAIWEDAMLFVLARWLMDRNSTIPIVLREHLDVVTGVKDDPGPIVGIRLAKRSNRSDVMTVACGFWATPAETKAACQVKADVTAVMMAEVNLPKDALSLAVEDLVHSIQLLSRTTAQ